MSKKLFLSYMIIDRLGIIKSVIDWLKPDEILIRGSIALMDIVEDFINIIIFDWKEYFEITVDIL